VLVLFPELRALGVADWSDDGIVIELRDRAATREPFGLDAEHHMKGFVMTNQLAPAAPERTMQDVKNIAERVPSRGELGRTGVTHR
jgi:hypothetical protein